MEITVFENTDFGKIRTLEISGEPWFVGKDIAQALGYTKPENAIAAHVDKEDKTTTLIQGTGSNYKSNAVIINESGLYSLVLSSKLPSAKAFKRWVTSEVLPSIRKTGSYSINQTADSYMISDPIQRAERWIEEEKVRQALALKVESQSKELKIGERKFIKFLLDNKYVYRDCYKRLMPYTNKNNGLFEVKETKSMKSDWSGVRTMITPKGRETFRLLLNKGVIV